MAGATVHRGGRAARIVIIALTVGAPMLALGTTPTSAASASVGDRELKLPAPVREVDPLANKELLLRPDRLRKSQVPGKAVDHETVRVALGPTGAPASVTDTQQLVIRGAGNYIIRELGPAREAVGLGGTVPPVLELGTVVWQGFSPGTRELSARLTLDPGIEAARLPLTARFTFRSNDGHTARLGPGAAAPAAGSVTITLTNNTTSHRIIDTGVADVAPLAKALDRLRRAGANPRAAVPPTGGAGLPATLPGRTTGGLAVDVVAPLRVTGTITAPGGTPAIHGPATSPAAGGVAVDGTLSASVGFTVGVNAGDRIAMNLDVRPWLDPRTVTPPAPYRSWKKWAQSTPSPADIADATQTLVLATAAAARSAEYSPYLQADAPGPDLSTFTYVIAPPARVRHLVADMQPRPGAIAAAAVAMLAIVGNAAMLRRQL